MAPPAEKQLTQKGKLIFKPKPLPTIDCTPFRAPPEDVLLSASSDDDSDDTRSAKRHKREAAAQFYLRTGEPKLIATAQLRGPFEPGLVVKEKRQRLVARKVERKGKLGLVASEEDKSRTITKRKRRRADQVESPSLHFSHVSLAPSSSTPVYSPLQAKRPKPRQQVGADVPASAPFLEYTIDGAVNRTETLDSGIPVATTQLQAGNTSVHTTDKLERADAGSRASKRRKEQILEASLPGQSPFEYVPTRLLRRHEEQAREWQPTSRERTESTDHREKSVNTQDMVDEKDSEPTRVCRRSIKKRRAHDTETTSPDVSMAIASLEPRKSSTRVRSTEISKSRYLTDEAQSEERHVSPMPPQLPMLDMSGWQEGFDLDHEEAATARHIDSHYVGDDHFQGISNGNELGNRDQEPSGQVLIFDDIANEADGPPPTVSEAIPEAQEDHQALELPEPVTLDLETEKPLTDYRPSQYAVSTQAAFQQALAGLQTPRGLDVSLLNFEQSGFSKQSEKAVPSPTLDPDIATQDLLAKAPRFSVSPDMRRQTKSFKSLSESLGSAKADEGDEATTPTQDPSAEHEFDLEKCMNNSTSFINIMPSTKRKLKSHDISKSFSQGATPRTTKKKSSKSFSGPHGASLSSPTRIPKDTPDGTRRIASQSQVSTSQDILGFRVTKQKTRSPLKSTFGSLKMSSEWQDAQRLDHFSAANAGIMSDGKLNETIQDIQGFLGSWLSEETSPTKAMVPIASQ